MARSLCAAPGTRAGSVFCGDRRRHLREARNTNRHTAACDRQAARCRSDGFSGFARHGGRRRYLARLGEPACASKAARRHITGDRRYRAAGYVAIAGRRCTTLIVFFERRRARRRRTYIRNGRMVAAGRHPAHRCPLRGIRIAIDPYSRIVRTPDQARAVRGDGVRCVTETILSSAPAFESGGRWSSVERPT